jgi:hypothetical protein
MGKAKLTISIDAGLAEYLRGTPSVSSTIAEAVEAYRARELEAELEEAYREDAAEAERLNREWESADAETVE